jgi:hypothetical protein
VLSLDLGAMGAALWDSVLLRLGLLGWEILQARVRLGERRQVAMIHVQSITQRGAWIDIADCIRQNPVATYWPACLASPQSFL